MPSSPENFIALFEEYLEDSTAPRAFITWTAVACIAAVLERRVYLRGVLDQGPDILFPNLYTMLVAPSGIGKGTAIKPARALLGEVKGLVLSPNRVTWERISQIFLEEKKLDERITLKRLVGLHRKEEKEEVYQHSSVAMLLPEFIVFMSVGDEKLSQTLTDWFDCLDYWGYETKHQGHDNHKNICVNMLGGTTPAAIQQCFPTQALEAGLSARILFVYAGSNRAAKRGQGAYTERHKELESLMVNSLGRMYELCGEYRVTGEVDTKYFDWLELKGGDKWLSQIEDVIDGYVQRRELHLKKLMMVLNASRGGGMRLEMCDFKQALNYLHQMEKMIPMSFTKLQVKDLCRLTDEVYRFGILQERVIGQEELWSRFGTKIPTMSLLLDTLGTMVKAGWVKVTKHPRSGRSYYKFLPKEKEEEK